MTSPAVARRALWAVVLSLALLVAAVTFDEGGAAIPDRHWLPTTRIPLHRDATRRSGARRDGEG